MPATLAPKRLHAELAAAVKKPDSTSIPLAADGSVYVFQNHPNDEAVTLRENPNKRRNLGWICWSHGVLCLKQSGLLHVKRHLITEIEKAGGNFKNLTGYSEEHAPSTHCGICVGYEGEVRFGRVEDALRYLKQYFPLVAHPSNRGLNGHPAITQAWLDAL